MNTFLGILLLAALVGAVYLFQRVVGRGVTAVSGAITGNTRKRGLEAVHLKTEFIAPVPGNQIVDRIQETLELGQKSAQGLKLAGVSEDGSGLLIEQGNVLVSHLQFIVDTEPTDTGCTGFATTAKWLESDGQITTTENIERIHKHVRSAVEHFSGTYSESSNK